MYCRCPRRLRRARRSVDGVPSRKPGSALAAAPRRPVSRHAVLGSHALQLVLGGMVLRGAGPTGDIPETPAALPDEIMLTAAPEAEEAEKEESPAGAAACPLRADLLGFAVGPTNTNCQAPAGKFGASRLAQYIVRGAGNNSSLTVGEQFSVLDDPYNVFAALKPVSAPLTNGRFDDCYSLFTDKPLPADFVLQIEQNHLINGQIISKVRVTYTPTGVRVCQHRRLTNSCDFSKRCK